MRTNKWTIQVASLMALAVCFLPAGPASADLTTGLIGYWPLDEGSGTTTADMSPEGNDGVLINGPTWVTGKIGSAVAFYDAVDRGIFMNTDATVDSAAIPAVLMPVTAVSVSAWVKADSFNDYEGIFSNYFWTGSSQSGYALQTSNPSGGWWWWVDTNDGVSSNYISLQSIPGATGVWVHLVGTYDQNAAGGQGEARFYVNGQSVGSTQGGVCQYGIDWSPIPWNCGIGMYNDDNEDYQFNGAIDEVAVWDRALTAGEVTQIYNGGSGRGLLQEPIIGVNPTALSVSETGPTSDTYSVVLLREPNTFHGPGQVVISISKDASQLQTNKTSLTFTPANWDTAQTVTVTAVDDSAIEQDHTSLINHSVSSDDPSFNGTIAPSVFVNIEDNDVPGIVLAETGGWTYVAEQGTTVDTYTLVLALAPDPNNINIIVEPNQANTVYQNDVQISVNGTTYTSGSLTLTFTAANWNTAQTIYVKAVNDAVAETFDFQVIRHTLVHNGSNYNWPLLPAIPDVTAYVGDNDGPVQALNKGIILLLDYEAPTRLGVDTSGSGANGRPFGDPNLAPGKIGTYALNLDGDDYLSNSDPNVLRPASAITLSSWVKADSFNQYSGILGNLYDSGVDESGYTLEMYSDHYTFDLTLQDTGRLTRLHSPTGAQTGQWYHLVGTYDGATMVMYVNGAPVATAARTGSIDYATPYNPDGNHIGRFKDNNEDIRVPGQIDQSAIWNRALTLAEVQTLYGAGNGYNLSALAAQPGIIIKETNSTTDVFEADAGQGDSYTVELTTTPSSTVTVTITPPAELNVGAGGGNNRNLTFNAAGAPQTVNVTSVIDDEQMTIGQLEKLTHKSTSSDVNYARTSPAYGDVQVEILQNECGAWGYSVMDFNQDCYVDLKDFAEFALQWAYCSVPYEPNCQDMIP